MRKVILCCVLVAVGISSYSQNYDLKVLATHGKNEYRTANSEWKQLLTGSRLVKTDLIKVGKDGYVGFVHRSGYAVEWRKEGTFPITEVESSGVKTSSLVGKYADFLVKKTNEKIKSNTVSGGVHRGGFGGIHVYAPESSKVSGRSILLSWEIIDGDSKSYNLRITDMFGESLLEEELNETEYTLDLGAFDVDNGQSVIAIIKNTDDPSKVSSEVLMTKVEMGDKGKYRQYNALVQSLDLNTSLGNFILAGFFEDNKLIIDAFSAYKAAIRLAPGVTAYEEALAKFLLRNQLNAK